MGIKSSQFLPSLNHRIMEKKAAHHVLDEEQSSQVKHTTALPGRWVSNCIYCRKCNLKYPSAHSRAEEVQSYFNLFTSRCNSSTVKKCSKAILHQIAGLLNINSFTVLKRLPTWFLVDEYSGFTGRKGTTVVSVTSVLWFWVASQTAQGREKRE